VIWGRTSNADFLRFGEKNWPLVPFRFTPRPEHQAGHMLSIGQQLWEKELFSYKRSRTVVISRAQGALMERPVSAESHAGSGIRLGMFSTLFVVHLMMIFMIGLRFATPALGDSFNAMPAATAP